MIQSIAFLTYAVSDIKAARHFYEDMLGLKLTHEAGGEWFEYDVGDTTFAISAADAGHLASFSNRRWRHSIPLRWHPVRNGAGQPMGSFNVPGRFCGSIVDRRRQRIR